MWKVAIRHDVIKGQWSESHQKIIHWEHFYVVAYGNGMVYIHFYHFGDNWELANRLVKRIETSPDFDPQNSKWWIRIYDTKPIRPYHRKLLWWLQK